MSGLTNSRPSYSLKITFIFLAALFLVSSSGCGGQQEGLVRHFSLTLALSEPLGQAGAPLPEDIKAMLVPMAANNCSGILFIPDVKIIRLDLPGSKPEEMDLGREENAIQIASGQALEPEIARSEREAALKKQRITALMAQPAGPSSVTLESVKELLVADQQVFTTEGTQQAIGTTLTANNVIVTRAQNELITKMTSVFCNKLGAKPQPIGCLIIYKPGTLFSEPTLAGNTGGTTSGGDTTSEPQGVPRPPQSSEEADELYYQLSAEVQQAIAAQTNRKAVHARLSKAQAEMSWDYRFTYERAKLAIYGTAHHDEAFYHLYRAAEIAIENGEAGNMLAKLQGDADEGGPFHKLSHGHQEWKNLLQGLKMEDASIVRR